MNTGDRALIDFPQPLVRAALAGLLEQKLQVRISLCSGKSSLSLARRWQPAWVFLACGAPPISREDLRRADRLFEIGPRPEAIVLIAPDSATIIRRLTPSETLENPSFAAIIAALGRPEY
jgi:DNA-binding NarL/FixJ family response regulator